MRKLSALLVGWLTLFWVGFAAAEQMALLQLQGAGPVAKISSGACVLWTPANLPLTPLVLLDSGVGVSSSGGNLTAWTNFGSAGAVASITASAPTIQASVFSGATGSLPSVRFAASNQAIQIASGFAGANPVYTIAVLKRTSAVNAGGLWGSGWGPGFQSGTAGVVVYGNWNQTLASIVPGSVVGFNRGNSTVSVAGPATSTDTTNPHFFSMLMGSSPTPYVRADGSAVTANFGPNAFTTNSAATSIDVGASTYASPSEGLAADLGFLMIYPGSLSGGDEAKMEQYVKWRWFNTASQPCQ